MERFDKEFGEETCIKATYPSITKANREIMIKYGKERENKYMDIGAGEEG